MKNLKIFSGLLLVTFAVAAFKPTIGTPSKIAEKGFAVVELFTSEGCSSCPPADALIARVQKESAGKPVYILAFHVDYWNRLGWKDVFSDAAYSQRQQHYSKWLNTSEVYTPQAIVNGRAEFVGSEESTLRNALKKGLIAEAKTEIVLSNLKPSGDKISLQYHTEGERNGSSLMFALVEKNASTKVARGENAGRTLSHVQIVRKLQSVELGNNPNGSVNITTPAGFNAEGFEVIAFAQNNTNGSITGATRAEFPATISNGTK